MAFAREALVGGYDTQKIIVKDRATCGEAWNEGIQQARAPYILLSADDITPQPGWLQVGRQWVDDGYLPCPRVLNPDGTLQSCGPNTDENPTGFPSDIARVPFLSREQAEAIFPIQPIHYATDYLVAYRAGQSGWPCKVVREMQFTHHFASEGRLDERLYPDMRVYWDEAGIRHPV